MTSLVSRVQAWIAADPDPAHRRQLDSLLADDADDELGELFSDRLRFGTSGIRGAVGPGPARMNRVVVRHTAAGLAAWLVPGARVVVGFDGRLTSRQFADDTVAVLAANGCLVERFDAPCPTPVLAHTVRLRGAAAGVMVTASHNPPGDNGVKVYLHDGAQPVPPTDAEIEAAIEAAPIPPRELAPPPTTARLGPEVVDDYLTTVLDTVGSPDPGTPTVAYTALHGVGAGVFQAALERAGYPAAVSVAEQIEPDGRFPTVSFPNPEEPGALDLLLALAERIDADVALAHDPDADRLAVALPTGGGYRVLSGDELGLLLCDHVLSTTAGDDRLVVSTIVSSAATARLAARRGVHHAATLTGFKWIVRPGLERPDVRFVFGYEEALGYSVVEAIRDKDGISAGLAVLSMLDRLDREGSSPLERLDALAVELGLHATDQVTVRFDGDDSIGRMAEAMARVREAPPEELGGVEVVTIEDLVDADPPADLLVLTLEDGSTVKLRPSGTEPKLKVYLEVVERVGDGGVAAARQSAVARIASVRAAAEYLIGR